MPSFISTYFANYWKRILQISQTGNEGVDSTSRRVESGDGSTTAIKLADDYLSVQPVVDDSTTTFTVANQAGSNVFQVDAANKLIKSGASLNNVLTQYATFGTVNSQMSGAEAGAHYALPFMIGPASSALTATMPNFGTGTDPATSFTFADANGDRGSDIAICLWYVHDALTLDAIFHIEGADAATADTTRCHLMSYDLTSGDSAGLTSGTLLAHSADTVNSGSEQIYKTSWTIDSADVTAGKVILAFIEADSVNSDYTVSIQIKYHLQ